MKRPPEILDGSGGMMPACPFLQEDLRDLRYLEHR